MLKEFKEFATKGNMLDMAVGIVLGVAFGRIISSLVGDILMPPLGWLIGRVDFSNLFLAMSETHYASIAEAKKAGVPVIGYGLFINSIIDFIIVSFALFLIVRQINRLRKPAPAPPPAPTKECPFCVSAIPLKATRCPQCTSELKE